MRTLNRLRPVLLACVLLLAACTSNQILTAVEAVVTTSEAVVNVLPNVSAPIKAEVTAYLALASTGVTCVNQELATSDTGAARALKIAACFSGLNFAGLSPQAQAYLAAVNAAVQSLLALFPSTGANLNTAALSSGQRGKLVALEARNASMRVKLQAQH